MSHDCFLRHCERCQKHREKTQRQEMKMSGWENITGFVTHYLLFIGMWCIQLLKLCPSLF
jgi:hypothetical protein